MRSYNFSVVIANDEPSQVCCSVHLDQRFDAQDLVSEFPRNVAAGFLDQIAREAAASPFTFDVGMGNSIQIVRRPDMRPLRLAEQAILLNLVDFGQDFETDRSTTIDRLVFPQVAGSPSGIEALSRALKAETANAINAIDAWMLAYGSRDEDASGSWPQEDHERYVYQLRLACERPIPAAAGAELTNLLETLHQVNMWTGYNESTQASVLAAAGRTGIAYEIEREADAISFLVERPVCNPAIQIDRFWTAFERRLGMPAEGSEIFVAGAD